MLTRDVGPTRWYLVAVHYRTALIAKGVWERVERELVAGQGDGIGLIRLGPAGPAPAGSERTASGAPADAHPGVAITTDPDLAERAAGLLSGGVEWTPTPEFADAMILRRARVVLDHAGEGAGRVVSRRPEGRGAQLGPDGQMIEHEPGRG